jgi:hypothetical protein
MPSAFREPKTLAEWIELDYHERPRRMRRVRKILIWTTLLVCAGAVGATALTRRANKFYQAGPLSDAHAMFNDDCAQCHQDNFQTARRFLPWGTSVRAVPDSACVQCHDGPPHHPNQSTTESCAACHREHRGRKALARMPDEQCTQCHANIKAHTTSPSTVRIENEVKGFPDGHPEFALWRSKDPKAPEGKDPGTIKFNHRVHLKDSGVLNGEGKPVKLECSKCHQPDEAGRYMKPINYEEHCASCHQNQLAVRLGDAKDKFAGDDLKRAAAEFNKKPVTHRKTPAEVRGELLERLFRFAQDNKVTTEGPSDPERSFLRPRPRDEWLWRKADRPATGAELVFVNVQRLNMEKVLFDRPGGCNYCHTEKTPRNGAERGKDDLPEYAPSRILPQWLDRGRFGHQSHRMLNCTECHEKTRDSTRTEDVLLPAVASCQQCHNSRAGARHDCVECHGYHDRKELESSKKRTIDSCLGR